MYIMPSTTQLIEVARKPYTCGQCTISDPDVPAFEVYKESKHGNIFFSMQHGWNWNMFLESR